MRGALLLGIMLAACGGAQEQPAGPVASGHTRLGRDVVPLHYALDLTIAPERDSFRGVAHIRTTVFLPTATVALHAQGLAIERVAAVVPSADPKVERTIEGVATPVADGGLVLRFDEDLPPGRVTLTLAWSAPLPEVPQGLYRVREGADWYAFTQFEPLEARRAFPCFDQPDFKTPYRVTLRVPKGSTALANAPESARRDEGAETVFTFADTKPLPTYLVAFAVGPFDLVAAEGSPVALRVVTTRGRGHLAAFALERTPPLLAALTAYFDTPYPYEKLDLVAVPNFGAGAMENVGLITFRDSRLLIAPGQEGTPDAVGSQLTIAHELAHMWFGDLVTLAWWDDLWLNEAFATWMAYRVVHQVRPELDVAVAATANKVDVMNLDAAKHARAIRQPIRHGGDVYNAFDGITYQKGAALLHMLEQWAGPRAFTTGVRDYLSAHAHGAATTADLVASLERHTGKPVGETARAFLDQPGTPLLRFRTSCTPADGVRLVVSQTRALPQGSDATAGEPWRVPVCVRYLADTLRRECFLLEGAEGTFPLAAAECPLWLHPNADEDGYYRWSIPGDALRTLVTTQRAALTARERAALPNHLTALLEMGELEPAVVLDALAALAADEHRVVLSGVVGAFFGLHHVAPPSARPAIAARAREAIAPHLARIGAEPVAGEPASHALLRPELVALLGDVARDEAVLARAREVARQFAASPASTPPALADTWLDVGARDADAALWEQLRAAIAAAPTPDLRMAAVQALGAVTDPALLSRSYGLILDGTLRAQDWRVLHRGRADDPAVHAALFAWLAAHHEALAAVLGPESPARFPNLLTGFCTADDRARVAAFFADPARTRPGTERNLGLALESIDCCARLRARTASF